MPELSLENKLESILFYKAEPLKIKKLGEILNEKPETISEGLENLKKQLENRGLALIFDEDSVVMTTSPKTAELIQSIQKEELTKDLSKAALETLSIIIYRGPIKRSEIDYIRGVNSQFAIRLLMVRGLIERKTSPKDERIYLYKPSIELLSYLGLGKIEEIPEYQKVNEDIESFLNNSEESNQNKQEENAN